MGNCVFKGFRVVEVEEMIKVVTTNGGIMELYAPITAECITNEFPGHALYRSHEQLFSKPLLHNEELDAGHVYYLLPLNTTSQNPCTTNNPLTTSSSSSFNSNPAPYRMSLDNQRMLKRSTNFQNDGAAEVFPRYSSTGVWKVKLVICPEKLAEILAQETRTEELIESVRTVAKCGTGVSSYSVANSDQWSVSNSWKGSSSDKYLADA